MKLNIAINMKNGDKKSVIVEEKDPKGYLVDKETGEKREISLTDKEVQIEYSKKIIGYMEKDKSLLFMDEDGEVVIINSSDISSIFISLVEQED